MNSRSKTVLVPFILGALAGFAIVNLTYANKEISYQKRIIIKETPASAAGFAPDIHLSKRVFNGVKAKSAQLGKALAQAQKENLSFPQLEKAQQQLDQAISNSEMKRAHHILCSAAPEIKAAISQAVADEENKQTLAQETKIKTTVLAKAKQVIEALEKVDCQIKRLKTPNVRPAPQQLSMKEPKEDMPADANPEEPAQPDQDGDNDLDMLEEEPETGDHDAADHEGTSSQSYDMPE